MKIQILIALAFIAVSVSAYGIDIQNLIATKQPGLISKDDLKYIIQSQYNQYNVVTSFFTQGDFDKTAKLNLIEFGKAYGSFNYFLTGKQISQAVLLIRWELADFANNDDTIDLAEFTFLVTLDLKVIYNNYHLFESGVETLQASVTKIGNFLNADSTDSQAVFNWAFFGFDYDKNSTISPAEFRSGFRILGYMLGLNLSHTSEVLNDLFWLADANDDLALTSAEAWKVISDNLTMLQGVLAAVATA